MKGEKEVLLFYKDFGITAVKLLQARDINELDVLMEQVLEGIYIAYIFTHTCKYIHTYMHINTY